MTSSTVPAIRTVGVLGVAIAVSAATGCMLPSLERAPDAGDAGSTDATLGAEGTTTNRPPDAGGSADSAGGGIPQSDSGSGGNFGDTSTGNGGGGGDGDSGTGGGPKPSEVKKLVVDNCVSCHATGTGAGSNLQFPNSNPSDQEFEKALEGNAGSPSMPFVTANDPSSSAIYVRTKSGNGTEMPTQGGWNGDEAASEAKLKEWINDGAKMPGSSSQ